MRRPTFITWDQLRSGALIVFALGVLAFAIVRLGSATHVFGERYQLITLLPSASGLRPGGGVSIAGQSAGIVRRIDFLPVDADTLHNVRVVMEIDTRLRDQIRQDSRAYIRTLGLLGDKTLDITPGTPASTPLVAGDTVISGAVLDYDRMIERAAVAVEDVVALTADMRSITSGLAAGQGTLGLLLRDRAMYDRLTSALVASNNLLVRINRAEGSLGKLLDDPTLYNQMLAAAVTVDSVAKRFATDRGTIGRLLNDSSVFISINSAARTADSLLKGLSRGRGSLGKMLTEDQLYEQMLRSINELTAVLEDFRRNPSRYTRGIIRIF